MSVEIIISREEMIIQQSDKYQLQIFFIMMIFDSAITDYFKPSGINKGHPDADDLEDAREFAQSLKPLD